MKLSILIPTIKRDQELFELLCEKIKRQMNKFMMPWLTELLTDNNETDSIGKKRNRLLEKSIGEYVAFVDADDDVSDTYIKLLFDGIDKDIDCCSLTGIYTVDGKFDGLFEHSLRYKEWKTNETTLKNPVKYERNINHLNCVKSSIAKQFKYPEINHGEDKAWSDLINASGLLKTEHYIDQVIYYYKKVTR